MFPRTWRAEPRVAKVQSKIEGGCYEPVRTFSANGTIPSVPLSTECGQGSSRREQRVNGIRGQGIEVYRLQR